MTSLGQKLYASLHTLELSLAFTTWSRAVITRYSIFFYELIAYHFFDLCKKLHRVKCRFAMHVGWCLTVNVKYSDCETTLAPSPQSIRWWLPVGSRPNEACTYVSFAFEIGGSQFESRLEKHRVFFYSLLSRQGHCHRWRWSMLQHLYSNSSKLGRVQMVFLSASQSTWRMSR